MDHNCTPFQALATPGKVTTFYAYEGGAARNAVVSALALHLASARCNASADNDVASSFGNDAADDGPILVIDWDLEAPALHRHFLPAADADANADAPAFASDAAAADAMQPGLLEFFETCRARLRNAGGHGEEGADRVIDCASWQAHIERVDGRRPLYLMRAGRFDDSYAGRAERFDWEALFDACPSLFRSFAARLARHFRHVLVSTGAGRSPAVRVCSTLLPDQLAGLFTPAPGSLEGFEGVVRRAIEYRCTHEDEQRPLLVFPLACSADGARSDPHGRWRRGAAGGAPGYQQRLEALLRNSYGWPHVSLESYFDEVQVALADAVSTSSPGGDRRALARFVTQLGAWLARGYFPWQSLEEIRLRGALTQARMAAKERHDGAGKDAQPPSSAQAGAAPGAVPGAVAGAVPDAVADALAGAVADALADLLAQLGALCQRERRRDEARTCFEECLALRERVPGQDHAATRAARAALASLLFDSGSLHEARRHLDLLVQSCARRIGAEHPDTLAARSQMARVLASLGEAERALALHEQVVAICERALGDHHPATFGCLEDMARSLVQQHEFTRARIVYERVLDGRRHIQGAEHHDTLRCAQALALLLGETGDLGNARRMLEAVLRSRERQDGPDAASTLGAREALAEILAAQGDLAAVRSIQESLARTHKSPLAPASAHERHGHEPRRQHEREAVREGNDVSHVTDSLGHKLAQLQDLIDGSSPGEARALADSLRPSVLRPSAGHPLRRRGAAMIKQVYAQEGDKDALLSFTQDEVSLLEGALIEAARDNPMTTR